MVEGLHFGFSANQEAGFELSRDVRLGENGHDLDLWVPLNHVTSLGITIACGLVTLAWE